MMRRWTEKKQWISLCIGAVLAAETVLLADAIVAFCGKELPIAAFALGWFVLMLIFWGLSGRWRKRLLTVTVLIPLVLAVVSIATYGCWRTFSDHASYSASDSGKNQIFGNRDVMVVVPHQDDDYNILGGVLEEYIRYGSEINVIFVTNGDYAFSAQTRFQEAVSTLGHIGIPESNIIFLGYGDGWKEDGPHIYNAEPGTVMESYAGKTETYGTAAYPAYRSGRTYTIDHLTEDLKSVILEYRPDVIFCSDYDHHIDHKAVTLLFDKTMGKILKENPEYEPVVYKAYAYGTAWEAEPDYYADNILSTQDLFSEPYFQKPAVYRWEDRVRLPVDGSKLSRSLVASPAFQTFGLYKTQGTGFMAAGVINGDRVFWQRYTTSLCLDAVVTASSGQQELLNDYMLIENDDLADESRQPYDGVWIPAPEDTAKTVTVTLKESSDLSVIVLYDHPSRDMNVLNAEIVFDDGTSLETGPLDPEGAGTSISVNQKDVSAFTVTLTEVTGNQAGLTEIEAFEQAPEREGEFLKLIDEAGNFLYDYRTGSDGYTELLIYTHGNVPPVSEEAYHIHADTDTGSAVLEEGVIRVYCPPGESFALNIECDAVSISDSIVVRNPGMLERMWMDVWQDVEEAFYTRYREKAYQSLTLVRVVDKISYVIRHAL